MSSNTPPGQPTDRTLTSAGATSAAGPPAAATSSTGHLGTTAAPLAAATLPTARASAVAQVVAGGSACSLITEKDATARLGVDPGQGTADDRPEATQCIYGDYHSQVLLVNVVWSQGKADYAHARTDPKLTSATGATVANVANVANVAGLGDQAFELSAPHTDAVYFTNGDALIIVALTTQTPPPMGAALALAKIAADRL